MKDFEEVLAFRVAYQKLGYWKNKMEIAQLYAWVEAWCKENDLADLQNLFFELAVAYIEKEFGEKMIADAMKKRRRDPSLRIG